MDPCRLCPRVNACIPGEGSRTKGGIFAIGEAPGKDENKRRRVFIGKTGREVEEHYLPLAGLKRQSIYISNAIKCLPVSSGGKLDPNRPADQRLLESCCNSHLYNELVELEPRLIVPMGAFACRAVDPDIQLDLHHGRPYMTRWGIMAFPMFHPALGMHSPKQMLHIRTGWIRLKEYLAGTLVVPEDDYPEPDYAEVTDVDEIHALDVTQPMACDTESSPTTGPYFLTYSTAPGTGRLIRTARTDLLDAFQAVLDRWRSIVLFHFWLYDAKIVAGMGLRFPARSIRDTGVLAYHLGNLPQGLKALALRELGMVMQDFEDLVKPYSIPRVLDYYRRAQAVTWPKPDQEMERDSKTGLWKVKSPQGMNTKLKRFFTDLSRNPSKDVFDMWGNWDASHDMIEAELGPWPGMDIAHVDFDAALHYACRDADATLRLWPIFKAMRQRVRQFPQEHWRAA